MVLLVRAVASVPITQLHRIATQDPYSMAHILLPSLVFAPDSVSTSVIMTELALELKALGHQVTVLTTTPHYNVEPEARARQPLTRRWFGLLYQSELEGIPVFHAPVSSKTKQIYRRLLDYLSFHIISTVVGILLVGKCDMILAPSPPLTVGLNAWLLGLIKRAPFVYNVQEIFPDIAVRLGVLTNPHLIRAMEIVEKFIYDRSTFVTVISDRFKQRLQEKGVAPEKIPVIPNFVDTEFMQPGPRHNTFSAEQGLADKFVVFYAGNIGLTQGIETVLEAARELSNIPEIQFLIVGDGTRRAWLEARLSEQSEPHITLLPFQPRSRVPELYAASDVCLVPLKKGTAIETFPSKIYTIMASGRPAIVSADRDSELAWVVSQADCGWAVPPDDPEAMASAIRFAFEHRQEARDKGMNGRAYVVSHHSRAIVAQLYHRLIQEITGPRALLPTL